MKIGCSSLLPPWCSLFLLSLKKNVLEDPGDNSRVANGYREHQQLPLHKPHSGSPADRGWVGMVPGREKKERTKWLLLPGYIWWSWAAHTRTGVLWDLQPTPSFGNPLQPHSRWVSKLCLAPNSKVKLWAGPLPQTLISGSSDRLLRGEFFFCNRVLPFKLLLTPTQQELFLYLKRNPDSNTNLKPTYGQSLARWKQMSPFITFLYTFPKIPPAAPDFIPL